MPPACLTITAWVALAVAVATAAAILYDLHGHDHRGAQAIGAGTRRRVTCRAGRVCGLLRR